MMTINLSIAHKVEARAHNLMNLATAIMENTDDGLWENPQKAETPAKTRLSG